MKDRRSIEGTKERAADRGWMGLDVPEGDALNSPTVAESIVREFLGKVIDLRAKYNADKINGEQTLEKIKEQAQAYADIFMGKASGYAKTDWNTPERLGAHIAAAIGDDETNDTAAYAFFLYLASSLTEHAIIPHENDELDEDDARFRMDALVDDAILLLLGLPAPREEDGIED